MGGFLGAGSTIVTILLAVGLLVAFWFIAHAVALRFFVLFMGTMSALYSVWDIVRTFCLKLPFLSVGDWFTDDTLRMIRLTISFYEKSTSRMLLSLPNDTVDHPPAGV